MIGEKYISVPYEVEALQFCKATMGDIEDFTNSEWCYFKKNKKTLTCELRVGSVQLVLLDGDWLVKRTEKQGDESGGISVMKPTEFEKAYVKKA